MLPGNPIRAKINFGTIPYAKSSFIVTMMTHDHSVYGDSYTV